MSLSNNLNSCRSPLLFIICVETWIRPPATNSYLSVLRSKFTPALSWPPRIRTARSSNSYSFTARLEGHNKSLPKARSWNLLSFRTRIRKSFCPTTIQSSRHPSRVVLNQLSLFYLPSFTCWKRPTRNGTVTATTLSLHEITVPVRKNWSWHLRPLLHCQRP